MTTSRCSLWTGLRPACRCAGVGPGWVGRACRSVGVSGLQVRGPAGPARLTTSVLLSPSTKGASSGCSAPPTPLIPTQVRQRSDGAWIDATPPPGVFLCNVADCMQRWTGDEYVSTPHRVVLRRGAPERFALALFLGSRCGVLVESLPLTERSSSSGGGGGASGRKVYPPITAGEHLRERLLATYPLYRRLPPPVDAAAACGADLVG